MSTWRLAATNTHLYPGARLRALDAPKLRDLLRSGDAIAIEFADQGMAHGEAVQVLPQGWQLKVQAHTTHRGTTVSARSWQVQWLPRVEGEGGMKIKARAA
jgi:hypothetical protein